MTDFLYRTEDIGKDDIMQYFVETDEDRNTIDILKSNTPVILEGSRGTGKSFLMRVAEVELDSSFRDGRILPVYLSFLESSLIHTADDNQFRNWMLSKLCARIMKALRRGGALTPSSWAASVLSGGGTTLNEGDDATPRIESIAEKYENSWKNPSAEVETGQLPDVDDLKEALEEICEANEIKRLCIFFDEAAHVFRLSQQRDFFALFRSLRCAHITCNAAVYPGVTSFGPNFQLAHDATLRRIERDILDDKYVRNMHEIVSKQSDQKFRGKIDKNRANFNVLAYAANGNPRLLLKTAAKCPSMRQGEVEEVFRKFYRAEIWAEFTSIGDTYPGYRQLVDWGRDFVENHVLPATKGKNDHRSKEGREESTCFFWVHRDAPQEVKKALAFLAYSGIAQKIDDAVRGTRSELGTRYSINIGCLLSQESRPVNVGGEIVPRLSVKRFTEFGANYEFYEELVGLVNVDEDQDTLEILGKQLELDVSRLDLSDRIVDRLKDGGVSKVRDVLGVSEDDLIEKVKYVGNVRARQISNTAKSAVLEYLAG